MAFLKFTPQNEVGISIVDEQHKKLFEMLNTLHASTVNGEEQSTLVAIVDEMIEYTVYHFKTEEDLYRKYDFPEYPEHKAVHDELAGKAFAFQQQLREGSATISFDLLDFLHNWLVEHTTGLDQKMAPFIKSKGVS